MNRKRMATGATVYSIERQTRTPESILSGAGRKEEAPQARARHKRVWASVERTPEEVTEEVFQEARRRDPEGKRPWVMFILYLPKALPPCNPGSSMYSNTLWKATWCFFLPGMRGGRSLGSRAGLADPAGQSQRCGRRHASQCHLTRVWSREAQGGR